MTDYYKIKTMIGWKIKFDTGVDGNEANFFELTTIDKKVLKGGVIGWGAIAICHPETSLVFGNYFRYKIMSSY